MEGEAPEVRARLIIRGRVQGVFFRASLKQQAEALGIDGWVRNLDDGSVEASLEGLRSSVDAVIAWARVGPPGAAVESVQIRWPNGNVESLQDVAGDYIYTVVEGKGIQDRKHLPPLPPGHPTPSGPR